MNDDEHKVITEMLQKRLAERDAEWLAALNQLRGYGLNTMIDAIIKEMALGGQGK